MEHDILRIVVASLLVARTTYWRISEIKDNRVKPKTKARTFIISVNIIGRNLLNILVFIQLFGLDILPFHQNMILEFLGFAVCILAFACSIFARRALGSNWTDSAESQIKINHSIIKSGIYGVIRHPIAVGYCLFIIGVELLVGSWLVVPFSIGLLFGAYLQSRKEESILTQQFGKEYKDYMKNSKMFLPYVW